MIYLSLSVSTTAIRVGYFPPLVVGIVQSLLLPIFIFSTAAASGGHLNPTITFATMFTKLLTPIRGIIYVIAQCTGSIIATELLKIIIGETTADQVNLGICTLGDMNP